VEHENKPIKVEFAPGAFDQFDGTQEELNELVAEIQRMAETGELFETARVVDLDNLSGEDAELIESSNAVHDDTKRKLQ
jgi:hypothetical protein